MPALITREGGMYTSSHGPDALPGLAAWRLAADGEGAVWRLNVQAYLNGVHSFRSGAGTTTLRPSARVPPRSGSGDGEAVNGDAAGVDNEGAVGASPDGVLARHRAFVRRKVTRTAAAQHTHIDPSFIDVN